MQQEFRCIGDTIIVNDQEFRCIGDTIIVNDERSKPLFSYQWKIKMYNYIYLYIIFINDTKHAIYPIN